LNTADVERFLASQPYAATTRETYRRVLILLVQMDLMKLGPVELLRFVNREGWGNSQQYVALCACRKFLAWCFGMDHPALCARIKRIRPRRQRVLKSARALELLALFDRNTVKGLRDLAICALALDTGLRLAELCRLKVTDVDLQQRSLQVIIKGGQWGMGVFSAQTALYISEWLAVRKGKADTVFASTRTWRSLTREGLKVTIRRWGEKAGFKLSAHDLRRTFATLSTRFGAPSRVVQVAGRWSDLGMVEHYTEEITAEEIRPYLVVARLNT
jgi:integrase/recombinase XerD